MGLFSEPLAGFVGMMLAVMVSMGAGVILLRAALVRSIDALAKRQLTRLVQLAEGLARLERQQQEAEQRIATLAESHRRMMDQIASMEDRLAGDPPRGSDRILH